MKNVLLSFLVTVCLLGAGASATAQDAKSTGETHASGNIKHSSAKVQHGDKDDDDDDADDFSELSLSKSFAGESVITTKKFTVSANYTMLKLELKGYIKSGTIVITLLKPDGNNFKTIEIDPTSDVKFEQTLDLKKKPSEWTGDWQIKIQTEKAEGYYKLLIYTR